MFESKYRTENVYLCSLYNQNGEPIKIEAFISERNSDYILNRSKNGRVLKSLKPIDIYYHIEETNPIEAYLDVVPEYLLRSEIFKITDTVNEKGLKPKQLTKSLYN